MIKSRTNPKVIWYFNKPGKWQEEIRKLRKIILECGLTEELKWGCPCYMHEESNIVLIHTFKEYSALLFFKGALLKDAKGLLIQQTENVQAARQMRFTNVGEVTTRVTTVKAYIREAIQIEKAGLKVPLKKTKEFAIPEEFQNELAKNAVLKKAFVALTPRRQRGYLLYLSMAKQSKTREARIEKFIPQILKRKVLED